MKDNDDVQELYVKAKRKGTRNFPPQKLMTPLCVYVIVL